VVIYVNTAARCKALCEFLTRENYPAVEIHRNVSQEERLVYILLK
jgi:superfamily II DNA/RNA helicase